MIYLETNQRKKMDWHYIDDVSPTQAHHLVLLEDLREAEPITWALLKGLKTSETIAAHICWPHHTTLDKLRELKSQGLVWDTEGRSSVIWNFNPTKELYQLQLWIIAQRRPGGIFREKSEQE
jgi:methionine synthase II (cobalamin-independent)